MVLRIHVVRAGGYRYYVDDLVPGRAEGTLLAGEEPGLWWGAGADVVGLHGRVEAEPFAEMLAGRDPATGSRLRVDRTGRGVSGYDLTFGAPKSVSLLHLLAPREIAEESGAAHRAAVEDALGYLERAAIGVRRVRSGELRLVAATGMAAGMFVHRTSRALDPHLHSHVVAANVALGVDGRWSAVDSRRLFRHAHAAEAVYHARLRFEVGSKLGGAFEVGRSGVGDVVGVDRSLIRLFSQRSAGMAEYLHTHAGASGPSRVTSGAFHVTRPAKDLSRTVESLKAEWRERSVMFGLDLGELSAVVGLRHRHCDRPAFDRGSVERDLVDFVEQGRSVSHRDLVAAVARGCTSGAPAHAVESVAGRLVGRTVARPVPDARVRAEDALELLDRRGHEVENQIAESLLLDRRGNERSPGHSGTWERLRSHRAERDASRSRSLPDLHLGRG